MWGHGFALAYFDMFKEGLWLKRYRCPICGTIIKLRPKGYFPRFQSPIKTILKSVSLKESKDKWIEGISRSRQMHWIRALRRRVAAYWGNVCPYGLKGAFEYFVRKGVTAVSRTI